MAWSGIWHPEFSFDRPALDEGHGPALGFLLRERAAASSGERGLVFSVGDLDTGCHHPFLFLLGIINKFGVQGEPELLIAPAVHVHGRDMDVFGLQGVVFILPDVFDDRSAGQACFAGDGRVVLTKAVHGNGATVLERPLFALDSSPCGSMFSFVSAAHGGEQLDAFLLLLADAQLVDDDRIAHLVPIAGAGGAQAVQQFPLRQRLLEPFVEDQGAAQGLLVAQLAKAQVVIDDPAKEVAVLTPDRGVALLAKLQDCHDAAIRQRSAEAEHDALLISVGRVNGDPIIQHLANLVELDHVKGDRIVPVVQLIAVVVLVVDALDDNFLAGVLIDGIGHAVIADQVVARGPVYIEVLGIGVVHQDVVDELAPNALDMLVNLQDARFAVVRLDILRVERPPELHAAPGVDDAVRHGDDVVQEQLLMEQPDKGLTLLLRVVQATLAVAVNVDDDVVDGEQARGPPLCRGGQDVGGQVVVAEFGDVHLVDVVAGLRHPDRGHLLEVLVEEALSIQLLIPALLCAKPDVAVVCRVIEMDSHEVMDCVVDVVVVFQFLRLECHTDGLLLEDIVLSHISMADC